MISNNHVTNQLICLSAIFYFAPKEYKHLADKANQVAFMFCFQFLGALCLGNVFPTFHSILQQMCSHLCLPATLMSWHWRKLFLVLVKYKTFFAVRNFHNPVLLICGADSQTWANCAGEKWAFPGHPSCPWLRCYSPLRYLALLQLWLNCLWHWTAQITAWPTEESWNWHWLYMNMLQLGSYFVRSWVMPAAGPEKSEVIGNQACCNSRSCFLQPQPCVISVPLQLGRAFLTLQETEIWETKESLIHLLSPAT